MSRSVVSRRKFLKTTAVVATSAIGIPYVRTSYAAGSLSLGLWDHWVPGANDALRKICSDWGAENHVDVQIDFITSIGEKLRLTAAAEAQSRTGHDVIAHFTWEITVHQGSLEPVDDVITALEQKYGPLNSTTEYLTKHGGKWLGVPITVGTLLYPCCSRLDLYRQYAGIDLQKVFPPSEGRNKALVEGWNWDTYLESAQKLYKAGFPVGLPMGQTADTINWVSTVFRSFGAEMVDKNDNIRVNSEQTRAAIDFLKKLMEVNPPGIYAWDDSGNNKWLISGKGSSIMNPPSAWAVAKRDNPKVAENSWTHDMPRGPKGRYTAYLPRIYGIWNFAKNKSAAKDLLLHLSGKEQARRLVAASHGYDLPPFQTFQDFDTWSKEEPPPGTLYNYPLRGDNQPDIPGYPARPEIGAQIYNQVLQPVMVAKVTQGGESIDTAIRWAEHELEGYLRT
jgi:Bacterial extracellular solute-binding protein